MGRHVEETLLHVAVNHARARGAVELVAEFRATERNAPCLEFFRRSHFRSADDCVFAWDVSVSYPRPRFVTLRDNAGVATAGNR
jgi:predicted enzyme involved in methoxymalonyl-ACP biosynthesis